jgi:hypothetical protein
MLVYAASCGFVAVSSPGGHSIPGFMCAYVAFMAPLWNFFEGRAALANTLALISGLTTGWINIAFLASVWIRWRSENGRAFTILRTATLVMIPFSWIIIYKNHVYPREGHILWIASMVAALFSAPAFEPFDDSRRSLT